MHSLIRALARCLGAATLLVGLGVSAQPAITLHAPRVIAPTFVTAAM